MLLLWCAWAWFAHCTISEVERSTWNVRLGVGILALAATEFVHALPVLGAASSRALVGMVFFSAYAGWASTPIVHRIYADVVAATMVPHSDAYAVVRIDANAMAPAMRKGAYAIVDFDAYRARDPRVGDVVAVVFDKHHVYLKRLVALPGDEFAVTGLGVYTNGVRPRGWHNRWYPNYTLSVGDDTIEEDGVPLDRSLANVPPPSEWPDASRLPNDCYFVLGDNVNNSEDSHVFGCVPRTAIVGRVLAAI
jgi:signal peptidase I